VTSRPGTGKSITCFYSVYDNVVLVFIVQVNQQIETNHSMQDKLHGDLEHKDMALEIDRDCHEMHNDAIDIKVLFIPSIHGTDYIRRTPSDDPVGSYHRLNMELDLQVYMGSMCTAVLIDIKVHIQLYIPLSMALTSLEIRRVTVL
jgi:hypothetical protein